MKHICKYCGRELAKNGLAYHNGNVYQRYKCNYCHKEGEREYLHPIKLSNNGYKQVTKKQIKEHVEKNKSREQVKKNKQKHPKRETKQTREKVQVSKNTKLNNSKQQKKFKKQINKNSKNKKDNKKIVIEEIKTKEEPKMGMFDSKGMLIHPYRTH